MATPFNAILVLSILISSCLSSAAQTCSSYTFSNSKVFSSCTELPHLGASLYHNYTASTNTLNIAFKAPQTSKGWIAWGLNPNGAKMVGSQVIVAFFHSNGSMVAYPTQLDSYAPSMAPEKLSFPVSDVSTEYINKEMIIFTLTPLHPQHYPLPFMNDVWKKNNSRKKGVFIFLLLISFFCQVLEYHELNIGIFSTDWRACLDLPGARLMHLL